MLTRRSFPLFFAERVGLTPRAANTRAKRYQSMASPASGSPQDAFFAAAHSAVTALIPFPEYVPAE